MITIYNNYYKLNIENAEISSIKNQEYGRTLQKNIYGDISIFGTGRKVNRIIIEFSFISEYEKEVLEYFWFNKQRVNIVNEYGVEYIGYIINETGEFPLDYDVDINGEVFYSGNIIFEK
jgi:hypothetical protein